MTDKKKFVQQQLLIPENGQERPESPQMPAIRRSGELIELSPIPKEVLYRLQKFQKQLDAAPKYVLKETIANETFYHIPISYGEHLLKKLFFGCYSIECINYSMIVNEISVHARVRVLHPVLGQWLTYDGLAAVPILQDAGTKVAAFIDAKKRKAVALNLPTAYSIAVKNALKKIGKVFGGDLNRKHEDLYEEFPIELDKKPLNE